MRRKLILVVEALAGVMTISMGCPATMIDGSIVWAALTGCATAALAVATVAQAFRPALIASRRECPRLSCFI
jgi:hypothetical protein